MADDGPGFAPAILERLGRPYNSSKDAPGRGLGLFLALNVARALGGTIVADNPPAGGATEPRWRVHANVDVEAET